MIFDKNFDKSLYCILKGDKKNSQEIVDFITTLPAELLIQIKEEIKKRDELLEKGAKRVEIYKSFLVNGNLYDYRIYVSFDYSTLTIEKSELNFYNPIITLELIDGKFDKEDKLHHEKFDIGQFTKYSNNNEKMHYYVNYYVILKNSYRNDISYKFVKYPFYKKIDNIPDEINMEDLQKIKSYKNRI